MDSFEKKIENFAFAADLTLPTAREFARVMSEAVELFGDERRRKNYLVKRISEACGQGEQWAQEFATAFRQRVSGGGASHGN